RVDEVVVFHSLSRSDIEQIVDIQLNLVTERLAEHKIKIELTAPGRELLVQEGYDPQYGARPLKRAIQRNIEDALADSLLDGTFSNGDQVVVDAQDNKLVIHRAESNELPSAPSSPENS
ncbi:MAG: ATP-dependent Clp protease ATP-binding subunit ClpC, partial [Anaerolineae bacterium]